MANIEWSTQSSTELKGWLSKRFYPADVNASRSSDGCLAYKTHVVSNGVVSIARTVTEGSMHLRRDWRHIRGSDSKTYNIYFPINGEIAFTQESVFGLCRSKEMFILNSDRPLTMSIRGDRNNPHEVLLATVPAHMLLDCLPHANRVCGRTYAADDGLAKFAHQIFSGVLDTHAELHAETMSTLIQGGLDVIVKAIRDKFPTETISMKAGQVHFDHVRKYIDRHLSEQNLSVTLTAEGCGISRRYVHLLMSRNGTTFSDYVRIRRLALADRWLRSGEFSHVTIEWIARAVGFKSCSHFGRLYRAQFGCSPRAACLMHEGQGQQ